MLSYALQRAMTTFRSFLARLANFKAPFAYRAPEVICLPDGSEAPGGPSSVSLKRPMRKRLAIILAALAVPAIAAPGDFGALAGSAPTEADSVSAELAASLAENPAMPFERPGMSFPGSAFFFLADPAPGGGLVALPSDDALSMGRGEAGRELGSVIDAGPPARPFFSAGGTSHLRASDCLAQAIWYEAASESEAGQRAVAQVVLNRVANRNWPGSVCGVVFEGSERNTGCQFTFTCDGSLARQPSGRSWARAQQIAEEALSGSVYGPIGHATHYHTLWVHPFWASSLDLVGTIGAHRFYRSRGAAGSSEAFASGYAGIEPARVLSAEGSAPVRAEAEPAPSPIEPQIVPEQTVGAVGEAQTGIGSVREDYARAGRWRSDAARAALEEDARSIASENPPVPEPVREPEPQS